MLKKLPASLPQPVLQVLDRGYASSWPIDWIRTADAAALFTTLSLLTMNWF